MEKNERAKSQSLCVGIDLGTTNSVLATIVEKRNGNLVSKVVEIPRAVDMYSGYAGEVRLSNMKKPTLPSCVYYRQENDYEPVVGDFAKIQYSLRPHLVAKSIKSQMGRAEAEGLSVDIPDKKPAEISARILKHLLKEASKTYNTEIRDAVITVPANFDSVMCKATLDAAELAGIHVRNEDGSEKPVLLSEPNAVIYDLINQIQNEEISPLILDLSEKKRVMVFDLGGGTLDITMHEINRSKENKVVLKVDEIATNRYTLLGGDDFDEEIAKAMYKRYLKHYESHASVVSALRKEEKIIMPQLRVYAENLKLDLNERCSQDYSYSSGWDDDDDDIVMEIGGNMGGIEYAYSDSFTKEEVEKILSVFMAEELKMEDYKRMDKITDTGNIIYPILDVLKKAADKLGEKDLKVDAVIVNGGMSKFYMVTDRLKKFFGFDPIVALDPDQAVARGAAVYHYYMNKYSELKDGMKLLHGEGEKFETSTKTVKPVAIERIKEMEKMASSKLAIQWGNSILNDSLYLGLKNGVVHQIIPTGAELPFISEVMIGFRIEPNQNMIAIPIKSKNIDGTYRVIASGNISFSKQYKEGAFVAFIVIMGSNKVITMKAWTSSDEEGREKIEEGSVDIAIDGGEKIKTKTKFIPPSGTVLNPKAEIHNLIQLCNNYRKTGSKVEKSSIMKRISAAVNHICNAGNKNDFAEFVIEVLKKESDELVRQRLFVIARKLGVEWEDNHKAKLARICMEQIRPDLCGFMANGIKITTNIDAVMTLSICGDEGQLKELSKLHDITKYLQACLYTHARTRSEVEWIKKEFEKDAALALKGIGNNIQFSSYSIGAALRKEGTGSLSVSKEEGVVKKLIEVICSGKLSSEELTCCILAIGWICDQRRKNSEIKAGILKEATLLLRGIGDYYPALVAKKQEKASCVAEKMINGDVLSEDEEKFLLTKLEK